MSHFIQPTLKNFRFHLTRPRFAREVTQYVSVGRGAQGKSGKVKRGCHSGVHLNTCVPLRKGEKNGTIEQERKAYYSEYIESVRGG